MLPSLGVFLVRYKQLKYVTAHPVGSLYRQIVGAPHQPDEHAMGTTVHWQPGGDQ